MPFRLRHRRAVRFPAGRHRRVLGRPHHDAAALTLVIYGGYMLVTYLAARGIVKTALTEG